MMAAAASGIMTSFKGRKEGVAKVRNYLLLHLYRKKTNALSQNLSVEFPLELAGQNWVICGSIP